MKKKQKKTHFIYEMTLVSTAPRANTKLKELTLGKGDTSNAGAFALGFIIGSGS